MDTFKHIFVPKNNSSVLLLLHGTGADEHDLIPIAEMLFPESSILSLRGNVRENGMNRFFERYENGTFNQQNLKDEVRNLKIFLDEASAKYDFGIKNCTILGYSNGANFGLSFMLYYPDILQKGILLHAVQPVDPEPKVSFKKTKLILTSGKDDYYVSQEQKDTLKNLMTKTGILFEWFEHPGGHELRREELTFILNKKDFL